MRRTTFGFAARIVGGNARAARMAGLSVGRMTVIVTALAGVAAGLAGMIEVAAVQGQRQRQYRRGLRPQRRNRGKFPGRPQNMPERICVGRATD
jgi:DNA-binding transcriptional regulator YdaS (Cro superfamily)